MMKFKMIKKFSEIILVYKLNHIDNLKFYINFYDKQQVEMNYILIIIFNQITKII